jgi:hypothetical protein
MIRYICNGLLVAFVSGIGLFSFSGCSEDGNVLTPSELAPPTNLRAGSGDARVFLAWTASPDAASSDFAGYRIVTTNPFNEVVDSTNTTSTVTSYTVFNLVNGGTYTFTIQSVKSNGSLSQKVTIPWGPTVRYGFQSLYEYASTEASGLQFLAGQRFNFTLANQGVIDLWIDGRNNSTPLLKSPTDFSGTGWRRTMFVETTASSFDDFVVVPDVSAFRSTPGLTIVSGKVYYAITQDGNYVKFRAEPPGVQVDLANNMRFVNITVAYNSGSGHWAKTSPRDSRTSDN